MIDDFNKILDSHLCFNQENELTPKNVIFRISLLLLLITGLTQLIFKAYLIYPLILTVLFFCLFFFYRFYLLKKYTFKVIVELALSVFFCFGVACKFIFPEIGDVFLGVVLVLLILTKGLPILLSK